jgi:hypothetical protein
VFGMDEILLTARQPEQGRRIEVPSATGFIDGIKTSGCPPPRSSSGDRGSTVSILKMGPLSRGVKTLGS